MSSNKYQPHVLILPEDDANRKIATGFRLDPALLARNFQVLPVAGGWINVLDIFLSDHIAGMYQRRDRHMVLLIDFDGQEDRLSLGKARIPADLSERVFILGARTTPEGLKKELGSYETIGSLMAKDCREGSDTVWRHHQLQHNAGEVERLRRNVRPILFAPS